MRPPHEPTFAEAGIFVRLPRLGIGQRIAAQLRAAIIGHALPPGHRLPGQREMAAQMGVGVPTLREALAILAAEGLVITRPGMGTYVTQQRPRRLTEVALRAAQPDELEAARSVVEERAAARAAERAKRDQHGVLSPPALTYLALELSTWHDGSATRWLEKDAEFHDLLCRLAGRDGILGAQLGSVILDRLRPMRSAAAHRFAADDRLIQLHFDLAEAVSSGRRRDASVLAAKIVHREAAGLDAIR